MNEKKLSAISKLIPPGSVCAGCQKSIYKTDQWRLSIFGDLICKPCQQIEKRDYKDLWCDPALKSNSVALLVDRLSKDKKPNIRVTNYQYPTGVRVRDLIPNDLVCECGRAQEDRRQWAWDNLTWKMICLECYRNKYSSKSGKFVDGEYREDRFHRIFKVTRIESPRGDYLVAQFPYGYQRLPRWSIITPSACETVFELQHSEMLDMVETHYPVFMQCVEIYQRGAKCGDLDYEYDLALFAYMRACTLWNPRRPIKPYLHRAVKRAIQTARKRWQAMHEVQHLNIDSLGDIPEETQEEEYVAAMHRLRVVTECQEIAGENWDLFFSWILGNRTQTEIGESVGVLSQTISMRFQKIKRQCQSQVKLRHSTD